MYRVCTPVQKSKAASCIAAMFTLYTCYVYPLLCSLKSCCQQCSSCHQWIPRYTPLARYALVVQKSSCSSPFYRASSC